MFGAATILLSTLLGTASAQAAPIPSAAPERASAVVVSTSAASVLASPLSVGAPVPAAANTPAGGEGSSAPEGTSNSTLYSTNYRTINRWGVATETFYTKYDGFVGTQIIDQAQRGVTQSWEMRIGNVFSVLTADLVHAAVTFDVMDQLGKSIDDMTRVVAKALFSDGNGGLAATGAIVAIIVILILVTMFQSLRTGGMKLAFRRIGGILLIGGILFGMAFQVLNSKPSDSASYNPVPLTPGWVVKNVNDAVSSLAEAPARAFVDGLEPMIVDGNDTADGQAGKNSTYYDPNALLSCASYMKQMKGLVSTASSESTIIGVMDQLWSDTGLRTWQQLQTGATNPYSTKMGCRILDTRGDRFMTRDAAYITYMSLIAAGADPAVANEDAAPFVPDTSNNQAASYVAWAACKATGVSGAKITWEWEPGWVGFEGADGTGKFPMKGGEAQERCDKWWNAVGVDGGDQDIPNEFDVVGTAGDIDSQTRNIPDKTDRAEVREFLYGIVGVNVGFSSASTETYVASSFLQLLAFGFLSLVTFLAKLFGAAFAIGLWVVLIGAMFAANPWSERIGKAFNKFLGVTIFAAMLTTIMTFVVLFSRILTTIGAAWFGATNGFTMIWSGLSPIMALLLVHLLFTKVFRMPSPVTIRGAQSWGKAGASGALGTAAIAGVSGAAGSRIMDAMQRRAGAEAKRGASAALHKATGGRLGTSYSASGRRSAMGAGPREQAQDQAEQSGAAADSAKQVWKRFKTDRKKELRNAREWYRAETGAVAPGDLKGSLGELRSRAAERTRQLGANAQEKLAATPVAREVTARAEYRREIRRARVSGDVQAVEEARTAQKASLSKATAGIAAAIDAPAAVANRARLGVEVSAATARSTATAAWNSPKVVGVRADAALTAGQVRQAAAFVSQSDIGRATATIGRHAAKPVAATARGAAAIATARRNNRAVVEQFRAVQAQRAEAEAARQAQQQATAQAQDAKNVREMA